MDAKTVTKVAASYDIPEITFDPLNEEEPVFVKALIGPR